MPQSEKPMSSAEELLEQIEEIDEIWTDKNLPHRRQEKLSVINAYLGERVQQEPPRPTITDEQIKYMVNRFLGWKLPENFNPDGGISFKRTFNENTPHPMKHTPTGTNLFDYTQAEAMIRHLVDGLPEESHEK